VIQRSAEDVWRLAGDPARIQEWFPGIVSSSVEGDQRTIVTGSGLPMPELILTNDPLQHRFQYRITAPAFREHLSTLDVIALDSEACLVVYGVDAEPAPMALVIGGAAGHALRKLKDLMEGAA
jgi:hypothetical protein